MCLEIRPQCTLECHWRNKCWHPLRFQCSPSSLQVCSNYASYHWMATGTPLGSSISQCGSSCTPVYLCLQWSSSVFQLCKWAPDCHRTTTGWYNEPVWFQCSLASGIPCTDSIWFGGHLVRSLPSMQPLIYATGMARVVWAKRISFGLQSQIHKKYNGDHIRSMHWVILKYSHSWTAELICIAEQ